MTKISAELLTNYILIAGVDGTANNYICRTAELTPVGGLQAISRDTDKIDAMHVL